MFDNMDQDYYYQHTHSQTPCDGGARWGPGGRGLGGQGPGGAGPGDQEGFLWTCEDQGSSLQ